MQVYGFGLSEEIIGASIKQTGVQPFIATKFAPLPWRFTSGSVESALRYASKSLLEDGSSGFDFCVSLTADLILFTNLQGKLTEAFSPTDWPVPNTLARLPDAGLLERCLCQGAGSMRQQGPH